MILQIKVSGFFCLENLTHAQAQNLLGIFLDLADFGLWAVVFASVVAVAVAVFAIEFHVVVSAAVFPFSASEAVFGSIAAELLSVLVSMHHKFLPNLCYFPYKFVAQQ